VRPHPDQYVKYAVQYMFLQYSHPSRTIICTHSPAQPERAHNCPTMTQQVAKHQPPHLRTATRNRRAALRLTPSRIASPPTPLLSPSHFPHVYSLPLTRSPVADIWSVGRRQRHCCAAGQVATRQHSGAPTPSTGTRSSGRQCAHNLNHKAKRETLKILYFFNFQQSEIQMGCNFVVRSFLVVCPDSRVMLFYSLSYLVIDIHESNEIN
jgi:hypothetical protein